MSFIQYALSPTSFTSGLSVQMGSTATTQISVSAGSTLASSDPSSVSPQDKYQLYLDEAVTIDLTKNGVNGLDDGSLGASQVYAVYIIGNPLNGASTACIASLDDGEPPLLPSKYTIYKLIGYFVTNGSSQVINFFTYGDGGFRKLLFGAPVLTAITAGNATTFVEVDVSAMVPQVDNMPIYVTTIFTGGAAGRFLDMQKYENDPAGNSVRIASQVTSVPIYTTSVLQNTVDTNDGNKCKIIYKVSNSGDSASFGVRGFDYSV